MDDKTVPIPNADTLQLMCPTCGARYSLPKYVEGQKYGCKRCSASLLFGKFAMLQELGRGGFGVVYKAWQADLQRIVALKFLHSDGDESGERFLREARIAANLNHPNITAIYEVGHHEGKPYIAMQFVDGVTTNKAQFNLRDSVLVIRDAALAVDYAHARDIIHRDLKPHNIIVTQERSGTSAAETQRRTFVMDFGLARSVSKGSTLTTEGQVMGTPAYMSPEQAEGKACDPRSDVYSLGATLYALVTRRAPFEAPTPVQVLMQVTRGQFTPPSQVNAEVDRNLEAIILKAMALDPAQRYPTAGRLAADLTNWLAGGVTDAGPTVHLAATKSVPGVKSGSNLAIAAGFFLALAGAGGLAYMTLVRKQPPPTVVSAPPPAPAPVPAPPRPDPVEIPAPPPAPVVLLLVKTEPSGAVVRIGNREWTAPVSLTDRDLASGPHDIDLHLDGYKALRERVTLKPGPSPFLLERKLEREARKVAFTIDSEPRGAKVFLNGADTGAKTPHQVFTDEATGAVAQVELELDGFFTAKRSVDSAAGRQDIKVPLEPKTGTFVLRGAAPLSQVYLFSFPSGVRNARALAGLWSENPDELQQSLATLDPADAPLVTARLKDLAKRSEPRIRDRASRLAATTPASAPVAPERSLDADGAGGLRIDRVWIARRYRVFATSTRTTDFLSEELEPRFRDELDIRAEMAVLASIGAQAVRPASGQFRILATDGTALGQVAPGGPAAKVRAGTVTLKYVPAGGDPLLREFSLVLKLEDRFDLGGSLYQYSGEAFEKEGKALEAVRCFAKVLEEPAFPASEREERAKLPDRIRANYRLWVESKVREGKPAGDGARRLSGLKGRPAEEVSAGAIAIYAGEAEVRGGAASAAAAAEVKLKRPYEAMEWIERALEAKADPAEALAALGGVHARHPGLTARFEAASRAAEAVRAAISEASKPVPPPPTPPPPPAPAPRKAGFIGLKGIDAGGAGVRVAALAKDGPASAAGLRLGDVITDFGAAAVRNAADLEAAMTAHLEGDEVQVKVLRGGAAVTVKARLTARPDREPDYLLPEPPAELGAVQSFNKTLNLVFVRLEEGAQVAVGQILEVLRDGQVVGEIQVTNLGKPDAKYPFGSATCKPVKGQAEKDQPVRRKK